MIGCWHLQFDPKKNIHRGGGYFLYYEVKTSSERVEFVRNDLINSLEAFQEYNVLQKFAFNKNATDKEHITLAEEQKQLERDIKI